MIDRKNMLKIINKIKSKKCRKHMIAQMDFIYESVGNCLKCANGGMIYVGQVQCELDGIFRSKNYFCSDFEKTIEHFKVKK